MVNIHQRLSAAFQVGANGLRLVQRAVFKCLGYRLRESYKYVADPKAACS